MSRPTGQPQLSLPADFNEASKHTFCVLPWLHRFVNLGGEVQLCCTAEEYDHSYIRSDARLPINITHGLSDKQIGDSKHMRDIRLAMLSGEWPAACERCRLTEQGGGCSRRQSENQHFSQHIPWILEHTDPQGFAPVRIRSRDYRLGNLCNLRCRMCHPRASKLLLEEWNEVARPRLRINAEQFNELQDMSWFHNEQLWDDFRTHCQDLEHLHFAGGEPLIMPEVQKALELCVELGVANRIELTFNTNITRIPARHRALWPHFKSVNLICSIDAHGQLNDYIRFPAKWSRLAGNLETIEQQHEALNLGWVTLSATVQIYNIFNLHELIEYAHAHFSFIRPMPGLIPLSIPDYFNIQHLPGDLKQQASTRLGKLRARLADEGVSEDLEQIDNILSYLSLGDHSPHLMNEFKRVTGVFDQLRGESITGLVPELHPLMEEQTRSVRLRDWLNRMISHGRWIGHRVKKKFLS